MGEEKINYKGYLTLNIAYFLWGLFPIVFYLVRNVPPIDILIYRVLYSIVFLGMYIIWVKKWNIVRTILTNKNFLFYCFLSGVLVITNWFLFIQAVISVQVYQSGMGYVASPIITLFYSRYILKESMSFSQKISFILVLFAFISMLFFKQTIPTIALGIALTWGSYGFLQKIYKLDTIPKLFMESVFGMIFILCLIPLLLRTGFIESITILDTKSYLYLTFMGIISIIPLFLFGFSIQSGVELKYVAILQYIVPFMQLLLGLFFFNQELESGDVEVFTLLIVAVFFFILPLLLKRSQRKSLQ